MSLSTIDQLRLVHLSESQVPTIIQTYPISYMSLSTIDHLRLVHSSESQVPTVIKTYLTQVPKDCPTDL